MTDSSRAQGALICFAAVAVGILFLVGLLRGAWWSVAVPVGLLLAFALGLTFWVGWTIATVRAEGETEPEESPDAPAGTSASDTPRSE